MSADPNEPMPRRPSEPGDDELRHHRRSLIVRNLSVAAAVAGLFAALLLVGYLVFVIRQTQVTNTHRSQNSDRTLVAVRDVVKTVRSCVDPKGSCYRDGKARTAAAVGDINARSQDVIVAAVACASDLPQGLTVPQRRARVELCVDAMLAPGHR